MRIKEIASRKEDYSKWYLDVIREADLAENSIVRGCMVIKPHGYAIWENIQKKLDSVIKETGHKNLYFPIFIPKSVIAREAAHVDGFAKESAVVTHHRLKIDNGNLIVDPESKLEEEMILRPTSEAIMYEAFSKWIHSWRDLPLLVNQWANVIRWEMRTRLFLRTSEFLWQEGHTVHKNEAEAEEEAIKMLQVYKDFAENFLGMSVVTGRKSESEKFPGALRTYTVEALMQDGKALQSGTSHNLGDNFAKAFNIKYADENDEERLAWQTSWGMSTRIIGGLIMTHSDDNGLVLPPLVAPVQAVIVPIWKGENEKAAILKFCDGIRKSLGRSFRIELDTRDYVTPGFKFNEWEAKGVPVRIEVGTREVSDGYVTFVQRINREKRNVQVENVSRELRADLKSLQKSLKNSAKKFRVENTYNISSYAEFKNLAESHKGFINSLWCEDATCEAAIKLETKATTRCLPLGTKEKSGKCIYCGKKALHRWLFAQAY